MCKNIYNNCILNYELNIKVVNFLLYFPKTIDIGEKKCKIKLALNTLEC